MTAVGVYWQKGVTGAVKSSLFLFNHPFWNLWPPSHESLKDSNKYLFSNHGYTRNNFMEKTLITA